jgi:single-strand DNA-binding protein
MAKSLNSVCVGGNIGRDAELSYTPNGKAVAKFSLAISEGWGDNEKTSWLPIIVWDKLAESLAKYLTKGSRIGIQGRLSVRQYEKDNVKHTVTEIVANDIWLAGGGEKAAGRPSTTPPTRRAPRPPAEEDLNVSQDDLDSSDVPF